MFAIIGSAIGSLIAGIISLTLYILTAFGVYRLAKREGISTAWIAWIPICQYYLIGLLINKKLFGINNAQWWLIFYPIIISIVSSLIPNEVIDTLLLATVYIMYAGAYYKLFQIYAPNRALIYTITGIIISPLMGLYTFLIRNNPRHYLPD